MTKRPLTNGDAFQALAVIWDALHCYREDLIPPHQSEYDEEWDDICTAMAWITEALSE